MRLLLPSVLLLAMAGCDGSSPTDVLTGSWRGLSVAHRASYTTFETPQSVVHLEQPGIGAVVSGAFRDTLRYVGGVDFDDHRRHVVLASVPASRADDERVTVLSASASPYYGSLTVERRVGGAITRYNAPNRSALLDLTADRFTASADADPGDAGETVHVEGALVLPRYTAPAGVPVLTDAWAITARGLNLTFHPSGEVTGLGFRAVWDLHGDSLFVRHVDGLFEERTDVRIERGVMVRTSTNVLCGPAKGPCTLVESSLGVPSGRRSSGSATRCVDGRPTPSLRTR